MTVIDIDKLYEPLDSADRQTLDEDIKAHGFRRPILKNQHGKILAGHERELAAKRLGIPARVEIVETTGPEEDLVTAILDNPYRPVRTTVREDAVNMLRSIQIRPGLRKYSDRQIAGMLGLDHGTISIIKQQESGSTGGNPPVDIGQKGSTSSPSKAKGRDNRARPTSQPTEIEIQRRRAMVKKLWDQGYSRAEIAAACFVEPGTVTRDLQALKIDTRAPRQEKTSKQPPPAQEWKGVTPAKRQLIPLYKTVTVLARIEAVVNAFEKEDYEGRLARAINEARHAQDLKWINDTKTLVQRMQEQARDLLKVINDPAYRNVCIANRASERRSKESVR